MNPTNRLGLRSTCSVQDGSNCAAPLRYLWELRDENGVSLPTATANSFYKAGNTEEQISIIKEFFAAQIPNTLDSFEVGLETTNGDNKKGNAKLPDIIRYSMYLKLIMKCLHLGISKLRFQINKSPVDGYCTVAPTEGIALKDRFEVYCNQWMDPEEIGLQSYKISGTRFL